MYEQYKSRGLVLLGVNVVWDKLQLARTYVEVYKPPYLIGRDATGELGKLFDVEATPTSVFIGRAGQFVEAHVGGLSQAEFTSRIDNLLKMK